MDFGAIIEAVKDMNGLQLLGVLALIYLLTKITSIAVTKFKARKKGAEGNPHKGCSNYLGLEAVIDKVVDNKIRIFEIKRYETLEMQLDQVDKTSIKIKTIMMDNYRTLLEEKPGWERDMRAFDKIWDYTAFHVKSFIRGWIYKNHLLERTDGEFRSYVDDTGNTLIDLFTTILDEQYFSTDFLVSREDYKKYSLEKSRARYKELLSDMLYAIRDIARDKLKETEELQVLNKELLE